MSLKFNMISSAPIVNSDERKSVVSRTRRFYIDDILGSDFGRRCPANSNSDGTELSVNQWTTADSAETNKHYRSDIADSLSQHNDTSSEFDKSTGPLVRPTTTSRAPSSYVTSLRRFYDNYNSSGSSRGCSRQAALKDTTAIAELCSSTSTAVTRDSDTRVTSSTTSHPVSAMHGRKPERKTDGKDHFTLPAWVYCTRYSDRPSAGPRIRRKQADVVSGRRRRRRTSFSDAQLWQLRAEYERSHYISDERRRQLAERLGLHVTTVKIWFQNRRANDKKASGVCNELALRLMAEGLYDHHTVNLSYD